MTVLDWLLDSDPSCRAHSYPAKFVEGLLRRLGEKRSVLRTTSGKVLRFRLILKTEFRANDGGPMRDSLLHPGDLVAGYVNPDDVETALDIIFVKSGNSSEHEAASVSVDPAR